jgi:hypothetical protein
VQSGAEWLARHRHEGAHEIANFQCFSLHAVVYDAMHVIDHHGVAGQVLSNLVVTAVRRRELVPTKDAVRASMPSAHARARVPISPARTQCFCGAQSAGRGAGGEAGSRTHASSDRVGGELLLDLDGLLRAAAVGEGEGARALRGPRVDRR